MKLGITFADFDFREARLSIVFCSSGAQCGSLKILNNLILGVIDIKLYSKFVENWIINRLCIVNLFVRAFASEN